MDNMEVLNLRLHWLFFSFLSFYALICRTFFLSLPTFPQMYMLRRRPKSKPKLSKTFESERCIFRTFSVVCHCKTKSHTSKSLHLCSNTVSFLLCTFHFNGVILNYVAVWNVFFLVMFFFRYERFGFLFRCQVFFLFSLCSRSISSIKLIFQSKVSVSIWSGRIISYMHRPSMLRAAT